MSVAVIEPRVSRTATVINWGKRVLGLIWVIVWLILAFHRANEPEKMLGSLEPIS